jgi:hypothetical protein
MSVLGSVALQVQVIRRPADRMAPTAWALLVKGGVAGSTIVEWPPGRADWRPRPAWARCKVAMGERPANRPRGGSVLRRAT